MLGLEIDDAPEPGDQMDALDGHPVVGKVSEAGVLLGLRMSP